MLRTILGKLPRSVVDLLRRIEHSLVTTGRAQDGRRQEVDSAEVAALTQQLAALSMPVRALVADDAVDSGTTLATVLSLLGDICPAGSEIRSAAITQTLENPVARPDYVLLCGTLCRFPWSFDAAA
jgi:hypoxanthine phosphoribosyltransferase